MEENIEVDMLRLEDNNDYILIDKVENKGNKYFILGKNNTEDFCIRKVIVENNKEWLIKLDSYDELEEIMSIYNNKG